MTGLRIRPGGEPDTALLLRMFDGAVAWLTERGREGQWGSRPWSADARRVERVRGMAAGGGLLGHAREEARRRGLGLLRVDCWAGGDGALVRYYTGQGFTPTETFQVGDWAGQVFACRLDVTA